MRFLITGITGFVGGVGPKASRTSAGRSTSFNHEGPRRGEAFVTSSFAKQVVEIDAGLREPIIFVGDLNP